MSGSTLPRTPWSSRHAHADFVRLRDLHGAVGFDGDTAMWLVLGYDEARTVLTEPGWSSDPLSSVSARAALASIGLTDSPLARMMLQRDGADHRRIRSSLRDVFSLSFIKGLERGIATIAAELLDPIANADPVDLMTAFALPFPVAVIAELLGLDGAGARRLREESAAVAPALDGLLDPGSAVAAASSMTALVADFLPLAARRRADPADDLISLLATDPTLDLDEVVVNAILLAVAGHETTANAIGGAVVRLLKERPEGRLVDRLGALDDPAVLDDAAVIGEFLRLDGPAQSVVRSATSRHVLGGRTIEPGDTALVIIGAANRDPSVFEEPDDFRLDRDHAPPHLAFGHGPHHCLGAALARAEMRAGLRAVADRHPSLAGHPVLRSSAVLRGWDSLPVRFERGGRR
ncbi:cytochrome P450 [Gordonia sp. NPDC127522]|uniref:cytochrome P450 n=1 Tax=Gordonia sp. NPDC127522 TaxID=3345390 RepID=UPI00362FD479